MIGDAAVLKQPDHRGQAEAEQDGRAEYEQRGKDRYTYPEYHGCTSFPFLGKTKECGKLFKLEGIASCTY